MPERLIPGTTLSFSENGGMFSRFIPLIEATNGLSLSQVCSITGLEPSTVQNWVKRKFVARPVNKKYRERQLARILLISSLRDAMKIESIGELMAMVNGDANDESDDIISEDRLYDYFCNAVSKAGSSLSNQEIERLISEAVRDYCPPSEEAGERLKKALAVMVYAYIAAEYKRKAEYEFGRMKKGE